MLTVLSNLMPWPFDSAIVLGMLILLHIRDEFIINKALLFFYCNYLDSTIKCTHKMRW